MHLELKCSNRHCGAIVQEYELLEGDLCPYCYGDSFFERETKDEEIGATEELA